MNYQTKKNYATIERQIDGVRKIYSQIGQPLPADIIIELYRQLPAAMALLQPSLPAVKGKKKAPPKA